MPRRKRHILLMPKGPDYMGQFVSDSSPIAVFYKPHAPIADDNVLASKMPMMPLDVDAVVRGIERGGDRIGLVIADGPQVSNKTYASCIARTALLLGAVPEGMDVLVSMTGVAASLATDVIEDPKTTILYSDRPQDENREGSKKLTFVKDAKSVTGVVMAEGTAASAVADRSAYLSIATSVVSCCFAGRGAGAGVDWRSSVLRISEKANGLAKMVGVASCGMVEMPKRLPRVILESWRKNLLDEYLIRCTLHRSLKLLFRRNQHAELRKTSRSGESGRNNGLHRFRRRSAGRTMRRSRLSGTRAAWGPAGR